MTGLIAGVMGGARVGIGHLARARRAGADDIGFRLLGWYAVLTPVERR
jgi:hypothetical protein